MANNKYNFVGVRFGKILVTEECGRSSHGDKLWKCVCDCGNECIEKTSLLVRGYRKSCGCMVGNNFRTHNHSKERLHSIWKGMRVRCNNPNSKAYKNYGGRGIKVCKEWDDYMVFREWSLSHGYTETMTIERNDVNGNYDPSNCSWIAFKQQARNRRDTKRLTYKGETRPLIEWCEIKGLTYSALRHRLGDMNWPLEKALETPLKITAKTRKEA